jgi:hypothetical protein
MRSETPLGVVEAIMVTIFSSNDLQQNNHFYIIPPMLVEIHVRDDGQN